MSLLASPSLTSRTTSRSVGVSEAHPLAGRFRWQVCLHFGGACEGVVGFVLRVV